MDFTQTWRLAKWIGETLEVKTMAGNKEHAATQRGTRTWEGKA